MSSDRFRTSCSRQKKNSGVHAGYTHVRPNMRRCLALLLLFAMVASVQALSVKEFEKVNLQASYANGLDGPWRRVLRTALLNLRPRCATGVDDLIVVLEVAASSEKISGKPPGTKAAAEYLASEGVRVNSIYEGYASINELRARLASDTGTTAFAIGSIHVEMVCTSAK